MNNTKKMLVLTNGRGFYPIILYGCQKKVKRKKNVFLFVSTSVDRLGEVNLFICLVFLQQQKQLIYCFAWSLCSKRTRLSHSSVAVDLGDMTLGLCSADLWGGRSVLDQTRPR
jgi:hypothetical protein